MLADKEIDLSGLRCPLPVLRTKKALSQLAAGQILCVLTTDSDSRQDIPAFVKQAGHIVLDIVSEDTKNYFYIHKQ
ncbi:MAG: sulfurtransferase TusA family protein [Proteobacteria bacterium]|nr:sulfurtransferase TusA family protein [Pseudomonadota bacterium]